jgi:hypothetical protein
MKKSLSLLLAFALVFSMFSSLAFAADSTSVADKLVNAGIIKGTKSGDLKENETWKRQDVTVIIARLLGKEAEAQNTAKNHSFADVKDLYYDGFITYAYENGYFTGHSDIRFGYGEDITVKQFVAVMLRVLGYDVEWDEVEEVAVEVGLAPANTDFNKAATRGEYFVIIDSTLQTEVAEGGQTLGEKLGLEGYVDEEDGQSANAISSFKAVGAKKLEVAFNGKVDASKAKFTVKRGTTSLNIAKTEFSQDGTKATLEMASKLIKGDYTVTVSGVATNDLTATASVDNEKVAAIEIADKAPLDRNSNKTIYAWIKVTNQYGEDVTATYASALMANSTVSKGAITNIAGNGKVTITHQTTDYFIEEKVYLNILYSDLSTGNSAFQSQVLTVSLPAKVANIDIVELVKKDNAKLDVNANKANFWFVIDAKDQYGNKVDAANIAEDTVLTITNPSVFDVARKPNGDPDYTTDADGKTILRLEYAVDTNNDNAKDKFGRGIAQLIIMSKTTPSRDSIDVEVEDAVKVDSLSIELPDLIVAGEKTELTFEAIDQFGNAITNTDTLVNGMTSPLSASSVNGKTITIQFEQDHVAGKAKLYLDAVAVNDLTTATPIFITGVTGTFKNVQLTATLQPNKTPQVVTGVKNTKQAIAKDGSTGIAFGDIQVADQYGRVFDLSSYGNYTAVVELSGDGSNVSFDQNTALTKVTLDNDANTAAASSATLYGKASGTVTATIKLYKGTGANAVTDANYITSSDYTFSVRTVEVSEIESYEVADLGKLYAGTDKTVDHKQKVVVEGVLADGTKVAVPTGNPTYYTVSVPETRLAYVIADSVTGYVYVADTNIEPPSPGAEKDYALVILGQTKNGTQSIVKTVTVSKVAREATTFDTKDGSFTVGSNSYDVKRVDAGVVKVLKSTAQAAAGNNAVLSGIAQAGVKVTDQYGVAFDNTVELVSITSSGLSNSIDHGQSFTITVVAKNAETYMFKVVVVDKL